MSNKDQLIKDLESIIRLLADVWPADRENVAVAGAKFEEVTNNVENNFGQFQKLIDLSWKGIKHLYEKDDYFIMVKTATMQAINTIREYVIEEGDIKVEDFEKAYDELEKSLKGGSESADTVIELDEEKVEEIKKNGESKQSAKEEKPAKEYTLNDLAGFLITLEEESVTGEDLQKLDELVSYIVKHADEAIATPLKEAMAEVEASGGAKGWLKIVSDKTEQAIEVEAQKEWDNPGNTDDPVGTESPMEDEQTTVEEPVEEPANEEESESKEVVSSEVFHIPDDIEMALVGEFITECSELIEMAESALLDLEESPDDEELINTVFRAFHTIKGTSAFMGLDPISEFTHFVETLLSMVREGDLPFDRACADINFESIDILNKMLKVVEVAEGGDPLHKPAQYDSMISILHSISEEGKEPAKALEEIRGKQAAAPVTNPAVEAITDSGDADTDNAVVDKITAKSESESSVRVSVSRLDRLIDMVGELVIAHSVVAQDKAIPKDSELQKKVNHATKILRELQDTSLTLRMVPLKATFHKMNRLVRDLSRKAGKQVKFTTFGEDTEIDRNMVDVINEPLIHMLRNSLDHGIEEPEERLKSGKGANAELSLSASQEGGKVVIEIKDDGRGINKDVILNKAIEKGLVDPEKKLTEKEIYNLIFLPGFSSAEKVTDLSGRGVGMDVVRRSIEQLQGKVDVSSELGKGTTITIELPFTLAITDGMLVRVGTQRFIVPTINIDMTFRAKESDMFTMMGNSEQVNFRGQSVPVIRLHEQFEINGAKESLLEGTLLIIKNNNRRYALLVDEVIGQQQLVGKSIHMLTKMSHISGGAILGDGRVGLILDTAALMDSAA
ncbi:MAG: chemotaxis protein CheW [Gracilimonas sp.]|uniref:chemotaxis protein CheA n=1 Tax=Gracilimonas TaxID=649462 RepID=UPI001B08D8D8|nr:chemotaxis protein CheW [Gracilimonas sp.]MBO6586885.1 chemotaxis protein CheW [Gracilimonas sp.]MBO6614627.1 chemotaxis protein CheW [Gracilimonas sp.]